MNKDIQKFTEAYLSIITEAWDRYDYLDIIMAVGIATNYGKDPWVKGESGKKVFEKVRELAYRTRGGALYNTSRVSDKNDIYGNEVTYEGSSTFDAKYIYNYWKSRSQSGNTFDKDMFSLISSIDPGGNQDDLRQVLAPKVGLLAYAIWKVMNSKANRIERNTKNIEEKGIDFTPGTKVTNKKLILKGAHEKSFQYSRWADTTYTSILICEDPETGIKYKLRLSRKHSRDTIEGALYLYANELQIQNKEIKNPCNLEITLQQGKVLSFDKEWNSVTLNYITISSPSFEEVNKLYNDLYNIRKEKERAKYEEERRRKQEIEDKIRVREHAAEISRITEKVLKKFEELNNDKEAIKKYYNQKNLIISSSPMNKYRKCIDGEYPEKYLNVFKDEFKKKFNEEIEN